MRSLLVVCIFSIFACGPQDAFVDGDFESASEMAALSSEIRANLNGLTVWMKPQLSKRIENNQTRWVATGRTNQDLSNVFSFIPDDAYAQATLTGARTFEVSFDNQSELNTLLSDFRLFVALTPVGASEAITASLNFSPQFVGLSGSSRMLLGPVLSPVHVKGALTYRTQLTTLDPAATLSSSANAVIGKSNMTPGRFNIDFSFDSLALALDVPQTNARKVEFVATESNGSVRKKRGVLTTVLSKLELTSEDPYEFWPTQTCAVAVRNCLNSKPIGTTDFASCGTYRQVEVCGLPNQLPVLRPSPDDLRALETAIAQVRASLPAVKKIRYEAFYVEGRNATAQLVAQAWITQASSGSTVVGPLTPSKVNTLLDGHQARRLVGAAQQVVFQNAFQAIQLKTLAGPNEGTHVLLYFSSAARAVVITMQ
jgi:hypothetical protein